MRKPMMPLKMIHAARKMRERWTRMQLRRRGTQGIRKRGSWCGKMERRRVAERAETARALRSQVGIWRVRKRERTMTM
jgi:hypothetical protein